MAFPASRGSPAALASSLARWLSLLPPPFLALLLLLLAAATARAGLAVHSPSTFAPDVVLRVSLVNITVGCMQRLSVVVNGSSPGPVVRLPPAAVSWVRVYNDMLAENVTIHWHGLAQRLAPFADGTPQASQWPIGPGKFFDYEIQTDESDPGTYFYHSHVGVQALSASGPVIVTDYDSNCSGGGGGPLKYDDERVLLFSDLFNYTDNAIVAGLTAAGANFSLHETHGIMLNGQGVARTATAGVGPPGGSRGLYGGGFSSHGPLNASATEDASSGYSSSQVSANVAPVESTTCSLAVIDVDPGKTYRIRLIGSTGLSLLSMALEAHDTLTVVQVDGGEYNKPVTTDHLQLGSGQRFDVLLRTKTAAELAADDEAFNNSGCYYLQVETRARPQADQTFAVVRYRHAQSVPAPPVAPPLALPAGITDWLEYQLTPLYVNESKAPAASEVTRQLVLAVSQELDPPGSNVTTGQIVWKFNGLSWTEWARTTPMLVDIYQQGDRAVPDWAAAQANGGWDPGTKAFPARVGEVLELILQNRGSLVAGSGALDAHPMHVHGQHVYDIGSGPGAYNATANNARIAAMGYTPVRRDTSMLYRYANATTPGAAAGWRGWRVRLTNPGVWMIHCHTLGHMVMGLQTIWVVGNAADIIQIPLEESQGYFVPNGDVVGSETFAPTVFEFFNSSTRC